MATISSSPSPRITTAGPRRWSYASTSAREAKTGTRAMIAEGIDEEATVLRYALDEKAGRRRSCPN